MADKGLTTADLDAMDDAQLSKELEKAKAELFNLRFAQAVGSLEDNGRMKTVRRNIALRSDKHGRNHCAQRAQGPSWIRHQ